MKITKITLATLIAASTIFTACKKKKDDEDPVVETTTTSNNSTPSLTDIVPSDLEHSKTNDVVTAYSAKFIRNEKSTVSFSGQTTRLKQAKEIGSNLADGTVSTTTIQQKFEGNDGKSAGFSDATLNGTTKIVRSKTSASIGLFTKTNATGQGKRNVEAIDAFIAGHDAVVAAWTTTASAGNAGKVTDGDKTRYVDAKGRELGQLFTKSLSGALAYDQTVNHYLNRLDDEKNGDLTYRKANDAGTPAKEGVSYTTMEHHWDEAFGYIYGNVANENLLFKYIDNVDGLTKFSGFEQELIESFVNGRIAIVKKDYATRDQEIKNIREKLGVVIAVRAVNYLIASANELKNFPADDARRAPMFHDLSEGYGFINSLRYIVRADGTPYFANRLIDGFLADLDAENGFWSISRIRLIDMADIIAAADVGGTSWESSDVKTLEPLTTNSSNSNMLVAAGK